MSDEKKYKDSKIEDTNSFNENTFLKGAVESLLFVSDEPVSAAKLADMLEVKPGKMDKILTELSSDFNDSERGIQLREVAGGWRLYTHPAYHEIIEKYILSWDTRKLSQAALEALAIIAYHQPVSRNGVNAVRGVNSEGVISSLIEKGFVREVGRDKGPGKAIMYGTTSSFLEQFGLKSIKELPPLEDFAIDEESKNFLRQRLGGQISDDEEIGTEEAEQDGDEYLASIRLKIMDENNKEMVENVDFGDDERIDNPLAMKEILEQSITSKSSEFDISDKTSNASIDIDDLEDPEDIDGLEEILDVD